jgi:hypothetical protein
MLMAGFRHGQFPVEPGMAAEQHVSDTLARTPVLLPDPGYDEVAAKRIERELVELGGRLGEASGSLSWLAGSLDEAPCSELLARMEQSLSDMQADLCRLACEAKKRVRGE